MTKQIIQPEKLKRSIDRPPLAIREDGSWWKWNRHHTGIIGTTGSGKNSPLLSMLFHDEPYINQGLVAPYALISPKDAQLSRLQHTSLVSEYAGADAQEQLKVIASVYKLMENRIRYQSWEASLTDEQRAEEKANGRIKPIIPKILMIDEYSSELANLFTQTVPGVKMEQENRKGEREEVNASTEWVMNSILSKGRSAKVFVVMSAQEFIEKYIGRRTNFQNWIFLRISTSQSQWIDRAFGEGAKDEGIRPDLIPLLPNHGSAGVAYVREEGQPGEKVRFPYADEKIVDGLIARNRVQLPAGAVEDIDFDAL